MRFLQKKGFILLTKISYIIFWSANAKLPLLVNFIIVHYIRIATIAPNYLHLSRAFKLQVRNLTLPIVVSLACIEASITECGQVGSHQLRSVLLGVCCVSRHS